MISLFEQKVIHWINPVSFNSFLHSAISLLSLQNHKHIHTYPHTNTHTHINTHTQIHTHTHTHTYTYPHTYTHTYTHTSSFSPPSFCFYCFMWAFSSANFLFLKLFLYNLSYHSSSFLINIESESLEEKTFTRFCLLLWSLLHY
jgi:hypothetical protein